MIWSYGVTTVPARRRDLLPRTLASLKRAGFDRPRLFVDGDQDAASWAKEFGLDVSSRYPTIKTFMNWGLALGELYGRIPNADRYALFQDDLVTYKNLRQYLESLPFPNAGYLNLYTFADNEPVIRNKRTGFVEACELPARKGGVKYHGRQQQAGRGAVALVFDRQGVLNLLGSQHMLERPQHAVKGWRKVDGGIVTAMNKANYWEFVHNPSLVQHTGRYSTMRNKPHRDALTFRGEDFDALNFLTEGRAPACRTCAYPVCTYPTRTGHRADCIVEKPSAVG